MRQKRQTSNTKVNEVYLSKNACDTMCAGLGRRPAAARGSPMNERAFYRRFVETDGLVADTTPVICLFVCVNQCD